MPKSKVIAIANQKGGTGKTTTTASLGIGLAKLEKKVLLIDNDPQGSLTSSLGWKDTDNLNVTLSTHMESIIRDEPYQAQEGILHHAEGVDLLPANIELATIELSLVNALSRETTMKNYIQQIKNEYDFILIDCSPGLGMLTINALAAADSVIIPVQAHYLSAKGMTQLIKTISRVKRQINPELKVDGILFTLADMRTNIARITASSIRENYGGAINIYQTTIPIAVKTVEASAVGKSIFSYDKNSTVAKAYEAFTKEVIRNGEKHRHRDESSRSR